MLRRKKDLFWAFGPMIWTKVDGRPQLFDQDEFFEKSLPLLKTRAGYKKTGQDELDFRNGILTGHVIYKETYDDCSKFVYQALQAGRISLRTQHRYRAPVTPPLLEDFLSAIAFSHDMLWAESRPILGHSKDSQALKLMTVGNSWLARTFHLQPRIIHEVTFLTDEILEIEGDAETLRIDLSGISISLGKMGFSVTRRVG